MIEQHICNLLQLECSARNEASSHRLDTHIRMSKRFGEDKTTTNIESSEQ